MRYALLNRFQGTLLAAALGHELGGYSRSRQATPQNGAGALGQKRWFAASLIGWHPGLASDGSVSKPPSGGRVAISCMRAFVQAGGWDEPALVTIGESLATHQAQTDRAKRDRSETGMAGTIAADLAIATLPIALFWHDDASRQRERLCQIVKLWQCSPGAEAGLLAVGFAIAQALQDRLKPQTLLPQTIAYLKQSTANPTTPLLELMGTLEEVQTLVRQGAGLSTAIDRLAKETQADPYGDNRAIALAFYCFLSTPDDLRLALLRAARCGEAAPAISALTGALSGAHQGNGGLPLAWQLAADANSSWDISHAQLRQLASHLCAAWSGVYAPTMPMAAAAIAAPGVIRPR